MTGNSKELEKAPQVMTTKQTARTVRHFLDISDLDSKSLRGIIDAAHAMKKAGKRVPAGLRPKDIEDRVLVLIFEKPSTRTRVSFDIAMRQLGGGALTLNHTDLQLGRGESVADTARVLSRYADGIMIRANEHATLLELARYATIPVINGLTEKSHPCQVMADIQTFEEHLGSIKGKSVAWVGDGNNVAVSWMHAAVRFGFKLKIAAPKELFPEEEAIAWVRREKGDVEIGTDPVHAVKDVDCVVTDTWVSMGQSDAARRKKMLAPYAVDAKLMGKAAKNAIFMHCLPAYRGHEVTEDVLEGPQSVVFDEAENRLHVQKAILAWCFGA
ncbi:ornithine carbamoyltransferase [Hyphomicrobium facile]|uniref:Ornithine carbamoyltransferase n=2 Tax=Hyphomicrobium facile TaxID=51670 RepID=A0A1I7MTH8_9HYPH|nr:ornithine carbamoyltransferase [Hyphomicrobium facile]